MKNQQLKTNVLNNSWKILYFLSSLTIFIAFFYGITEHNRRSICCFLAAFIFSILGFIFTVNLSYETKKKIYMQLLPVYSLFTLFWILSLTSPYTDKQYNVNNVVGTFALLIPSIVLICYNLSYLKIKQLYNFFCKYYNVFILIFIFILLSIPTLSATTRLDTNIYYTYLSEAKSWNLSFDTINLFKLGDHQCYGYTLWGLIGMYLTPSSPIGLRCINLVLVSISIMCLYAIIKKLNFTSSRKIVTLLTALFVFNPLILGIIYEINLDLPCTCFYIWSICFLLYNKKILLFFSVFFLTFSKETGILLLAGIGIGWFLSHLVTHITNHRRKFFKYFDWVCLGTLMYPVVILFFTMKMGMLWRQNSNSLAVSAQNTMDRVGIDTANTIIKLKELFILNFSWLFCCIILFSICFGLTKKILRKKSSTYTETINQKLSLLPIIFSWLLFVIFQFIYITYCHIRYIMPYIVGGIILGGYIICKFLNKQVQLILLILFLGLLCVENFYTLDTVSKMVCNTIDIGSTKIYTTRTYVRSSENIAQTAKTNPELIPYLEMTQSAIYNRQFLYFEDVFEKFLREIEYNNETFIAVAPIYDKVANMTWVSLFGKWYTNTLHYNPLTYQWVDNEDMPSINLSIIDSKDQISFDTYQRIYLISFPYNKFFDNTQYLSQFEIIDSFEVNEKMWKINVYQLK